MAPAMRQRIFVDANRFLEKELKNMPGVEHLSVGRAVNMKLKNLNALITGGSQGLGKVIAEHFLREGANVVLCARGEKELSATRDELAGSNFPRKKFGQNL
jgi:FlaA1/EpsC-like NDP-sugar epimerase